MPVILSLTQHQGALWALGPEGLFQIQQGTLLSIPQPDAQPSCCCHGGDRLLVGGGTHGVAYTTADNSWQASWMDGSNAPVVCLAPHPDNLHNGILLAGSSGGGILRSTNHGQHWSVCNFGLYDFEVISLAWAPRQPSGMWPPVEVVFAGTATAIYRSPNGGRGWKQVAATAAPILALAAAADFHSGGTLLAGTEGAGLWRSNDGGNSFTPVADAPQVVNALLARPDGWLLSDTDQLWRSDDGLRWQPLDFPPALALLETPEGVLAGGMEGVFWVTSPA